MVNFRAMLPAWTYKYLSLNTLNYMELMCFMDLGSTPVADTQNQALPDGSCVQMPATGRRQLPWTHDTPGSIMTQTKSQQAER